MDRLQSMEMLLVLNWWLGAAVWAVVYVGDYYLTLWGATLRSRCDPESDTRYSYELTPEYQSEIDARKLGSRKLLKALAIGVVVLLAYAKIVAYFGWAPMYLALAGAMLLIEVPIYVRHARNIVIYRYALANPGWKVPAYPQDMTYLASATELLAFGVFFMLCAPTIPSWIALGGGLRCIVLGLQHRALARASEPARRTTPRAA